MLGMTVLAVFLKMHKIVAWGMMCLRLPYTFRDKIVSKIFFFDSKLDFVLSFHTEKKIIENE